MKQTSAAILEATKNGSAPTIKTKEEPIVELTAEQKALAEFEAKVDASLGIKTA